MSINALVSSYRFRVGLIAWLWLVLPCTASAAPPRSNVWVTYSPGGMSSSSIPQGDGSAIISGGGLRPPIFSVRLASRTEDRSINADLATPGGFDSRHVLAADIGDDGWGSDDVGRRRQSSKGH